MLSEVVVFYLYRGENVTVLARSAESIERLRSRISSEVQAIMFIKADYTLPLSPLERIREQGPFDLAILWIHGVGEQFSNELKSYLLTLDPPAKVFELKGSSRLNPATAKASEWATKYPDFYREVILGFKIENGRSRWLTDEEISKGTIEAVEKDLNSFTIGQTEPWEMKP